MVTKEQEELVKSLPMFKDYHPVDVYNTIMKITNWEAKALAEKFGIPYKNKRIAAKAIVDISNQILN